MRPPYTWAFAALLAVQALAVLVPRPSPTWALVARRRALGLLPLAGIGGGVLLLGNVPGAAERAADLAAIATPLLALGGLAAHRLRPLALLAPVLWVVAWQADGSRAGQLAADALIVGACATLAWLTGIVAPRRALVAGILVATAVDIFQIWNRDVQPVARALAAAEPAAGLPRLQELAWAGASMGWGDVYLAALLGTVIAALPASRRLLGAATTLVAGLAWGYMFHVWDVIPGTVPVAAALLVVLAVERLDRRRSGSMDAPTTPTGG